MRREVLRRLQSVEQAVDRISRSIEKIEVATIVREPSSALAADAYDGLRRQLAAAATERTAHLHQLAVFARAVDDGLAPKLADVVGEWLAQARLVRWADPSDDRYYEILGGDGPGLRVLRHALVDEVTGRPILMGQAERTPEPIGPQSDADASATNHRRQEVRP
jgi:hypothetical protein